MGTSLVVEWLGLGAPTAGGMCSVPDRESKIPHPRRSWPKDKEMMMMWGKATERKGMRMRTFKLSMNTVTVNIYCLKERYPTYFPLS